MTDEVQNVDGKDMPQSPRWIANGEVSYKPHYIKGFRISLEWQRIGTWYQDQVNNVKYNGRGFLGLKVVSYLNARATNDVNAFVPVVTKTRDGF